MVFSLNKRRNKSLKAKEYILSSTPAVVDNPSEHETILAGYCDGLMFEDKNPYKPYSLYWQWYMRGYMQGIVEIKFAEA